VAIAVPATEEHVRNAAEILSGGGVVAFPTETVYGLGGLTLSIPAVEMIHQLKGRPAHNPLIAHVLDVQGAMRVAAHWPEPCSQLAAAFWPGPLTLVVGRANHVPRQATGGRDTVAVRAPRHPVARRLLELLHGQPLSAPSANLSGRTSATSAAHVVHDFQHVPQLMVLDGGACEVGIESTVLDMTTERPVVLRPGSVSAEQIGRLLGCHVDSKHSAEQGASPGTASSHYAPRSPAVLVKPAQLEEFLAAQREQCVVLMIAPLGAPGAVRQKHHVILMPELCEAYAAVLYDRLRAADAHNCSLIVIQEPSPQGGHWAGVIDRLHRATHTRLRASES
jgi:L-threonylcarbamoyladenylate synthase